MQPEEIGRETGKTPLTERTSQGLYKRALDVMPGGVSSPVRAFRSVGGSPIYFRKAFGARFVDEDDREYVDYCMSWGPLILGHAHPDVVDAVCAAAQRGLSYGACCRGEVELAEMMLEAFPTMERVRFVSSGTEAVMTAIRLARGITGRDCILKFDGGYHGHSDSLLVKAGSGLVTFGTKSSAGVPSSLAALTLVCPLDDDETLEEVFSRYGSQLAAVVVEPLPANNGLLEQRRQWLKRLRDACEESGALLILDEVISGFRLRFGGYADGLGIRADLVTLGKIAGGGLPVGAILGPARFMDQLAPLGPVYQAGTLSGNPVSLAAGLATLRLLRDGSVYQTLEHLGKALDEFLSREAASLPELCWRRVGSIFWLYLARGQVPRRAERIRPEAAECYNVVHRHLLDHGIYLAPSAYEVGFLSTAHTIEDMQVLARELGGALRGR